MKKFNVEFWRSFRTQGKMLVVRNGTVIVGRLLVIVAAPNALDNKGAILESGKREG